MIVGLQLIFVYFYNIIIPLLKRKEVRKLKLIWDFKGTDADKIAKHHEIHLKQFIEAEKLDLKITGFEIKNELHSIAFMVVEEANMIPIRDALKPHRGELFV